MARRKNTPPDEPPSQASDMTRHDDDDMSEESDADAEAFAAEWEAMREKVARIPDDIGERLDAIQRNTSSGTTSQTGTGQATGQSESGAAATPGTDDGSASARRLEKRPKSSHWYFRDNPLTGRG
jgi:hypothetical protein